MKNVILRWKALWNPDMYHGWGKRDKYFEGWYIKLVNKSEQLALAIIPGISLDKNGDSHAFIQILDGKACKSSYHRFDKEDFKPSKEAFEVSVGTNEFSSKGLKLELENCKGQLIFKHLNPWPKMLKAPGIMGWFSFVPFMECNHGVVSVHHLIEGKLEYEGKEYAFDGGIGYMEKDWGTSFPKCWIWMQSNHFNKAKKASVMASVAHIPWLGNYFVGYIVGFYLEDKLYRFATYTGAKMKASISENQVNLSFKDRKNELQIIATKAEGANLKSPISGQMTGKVNESLQAKITLKLFEKGNLIYEDEARNSGLEIAGDIDILLTDKWRR